jgi:YVTN family beta-propeller protein
MSVMKRFVLLMLTVLLMSFVSCVSKPSVKEPIYSDAGQVFVYLSCYNEPSLDITFTISEMSFMDRNGAWYDTKLTPQVINSQKLSDSQIKLQELYLPEGQYVRLKWTISEASYKRDHKKFSLALPEAVHSQVSNGELCEDIDFNVFYRESVCLFVEWDADISIVDNYLFKPRLTVKPQRLEIENILAYLSSELSDCVTVIDRQEDSVVGTIAVGEAPRGIIASSDGTKIYVANSGSNSISVIDTSVNRVINTIENFGYAPEELAWSWDDNILFVTNPHSNNVSVIDVISDLVIDRINVGTNPTGIVADKDRRKLYVANTDSLTISVVDMNTLTVENTLTVSANPRYLALCDDRLYVGNERINDIYVIEIPSYTIRTINVGFRPEWLVCGLTNRVYAANAVGNEVSFLHTTLDMITQSIPVGSFPVGMAVDAIRRKLYVVNNLSGDISVIDVTGERLKKTIPVGKRPHGIALIAE